MKKQLSSVYFDTDEIQPEGTNEKAKQFATISTMAYKFGCRQFTTDYSHSIFLFGTLQEANAFYQEVKDDVNFIRIN